MYQVIENDTIVAEFESYADAEGFAATRTAAEVALVDEEEYDYDDSFDEVGFDPYMGDYSWDC